MDAPPDLTGYAHALGCAQAAWRFAGADLRQAAALATISSAWDTFRRDAGAGDVGPAHETSVAQAQLLFTEDPRRDGVLLWLADHGAPAIRDAAATVARMVGATRRFGPEEQALLEVARETLTLPAAAPGPIARIVATGSDDPVLGPLRALAAAVGRLRGDARFLEGEGTEVSHALPGGTYCHYLAAEPGGCWALNLALLAQGAQPAGAPPPPGLVSRVLFRSDLEPEDLAARLVAGANAATRDAYDRLVRLDPELGRGRDALAHLSRNARACDAWLQIAALGACTRVQLARALGLSRAGADIQARTLAEARLVRLGRSGSVEWQREPVSELVPAPRRNDLLSAAGSQLDATIAEIDRLLARTSPGSDRQDV